MGRRFKWTEMNFAVAASLSAMTMAASVALADGGRTKTVNGVSYWDVDPGPIDPGTFWTSGQFKYDPNGYMDLNRWDLGVQVNTVYADHAGKSNCVFRKRVINTDWDSRHPYLRVCRRPE